MYLFEWVVWRNAIGDESRRKEISEFDKRMGGEPDFTVDMVKADYTQPSVSNNPRPFGPYYAYNERFMEIRAGFMESYRGVITIFTLLILIGLVGVLVYGLIHFLNELINKEPYNIGELYFVIIVTILFLLGTCYFCIRYGRYFSRFEVFTLRHMRVRFNRITRQVHIQRPAYCGGNLTLRWDDVMCDVMSSGQPVPGEEDVSGMGMPNMLCWHPYRTGLPFIVMVAIGQKMMSQQKLLDEWEFIRRYMEEGPEHLPKPRRASLLPLPWHGFAAHLETVGSLYRTSLGIMKLLLVIFLVPVMAFLGMAYWASELLCWQPRWPKIIRQAGLPGKPVPPLTQLSDYPPDIQKRLLENAGYWALDEECSDSEAMSARNDNNRSLTY